jgi:hydrogenase nickel incorporation protein HypA/HybF
MHEVALATSIIEIASAAAARAGASRITCVKLRIGELTCADSETLSFAFQIASAGSLSEGAALAIEMVPVSVRCRTCGSTGAPEDKFLLLCPSCASPDVDVLSGREIVVSSIEAD